MGRFSLVIISELELVLKWKDGFFPRLVMFCCTQTHSLKRNGDILVYFDLRSVLAVDSLSSGFTLQHLLSEI